MIDSKNQGLPKNLSTQTQRRGTQKIAEDYHPNGNPIYGTVKIHYGVQVFEAGPGKAEKNGSTYKITLMGNDELLSEGEIDLSRFVRLSEGDLSDLARRIVNLSLKTGLSTEEKTLLRITQNVLEQYTQETRENAFDSLI